MAQKTSGLKAIFSHPAIYSLAQNLVGSRRDRKILVDEYFQVKPGQRVLDIGCGPGDILEFMPDGIEYFGFDMSEEYVRSARERFGGKGSFKCARVSSEALETLPPFDLVLGLGILHHLDDSEAADFFKLAKKALVPGGRLVMEEPCLVHGQSRIARYLILHDRGQNVRTEQGYKTLASTAFQNVKTSIRHDMIRIPYTHIIIECSF